MAWLKDPFNDVKTALAQAAEELLKYQLAEAAELERRAEILSKTAQHAKSLTMSVEED